MNVGTQSMNQFFANCNTHHHSIKPDATLVSSKPINESQILKSMMVASRPFYNLIKLIFLRVYSSLKPHISFYSNHLASSQFSDITHNNVNNGLKWAIFNLIELTSFRVYPYLKLHVLFYIKAIWHDFTDIRNIKDNFGKWFHKPQKAHLYIP